MVVWVLEVVVERSVEISEGSLVSVYCGCGSNGLAVVPSEKYFFLLRHTPAKFLQQIHFANGR